MPTAGNLAAFKIQNAAGVLTDLAAHCKQLELQFPVDTDDTTTFGKTSHTKAPTLKDSSFSISGLWDGTAGSLDATLWGIRGLVRNFEAGPEGSATGKVKYSGACVLKTYTIPVNVGSTIPFSAQFEGSDEITRGVWP